MHVVRVLCSRSCAWIGKVLHVLAPGALQLLSKPEYKYLSYPKSSFFLEQSPFGAMGEK